MNYFTIDTAHEHDTHTDEVDAITAVGLILCIGIILRLLFGRQ